jgi:hypothetical protein
MPKGPEPVVLELASLPREQVGPFLLLGLDKTADKEEIEAHWAERIKWARKGLAKVPLEDINWARDGLADLQRRLRADSASLNVDPADRPLDQLARRYGGEGAPAWKPLDREKPLADYTPAADVPDVRQLAAGLRAPEAPQELPAVAALLERFAAGPLDPWAVERPGGD